MLIAIDGFEASSTDQVGVGRFEVELLKEMGRVDLRNSYRVYTPFRPNPGMPAASKNWKYRTPAFHTMWSQLTLPACLYLDSPRPDVFFAPVHYSPRFCPIPTVVGIMDLSFLHFPELFKKSDLYKLTHWTAYSIKGAQAIIAISRSTKNDILEAYKIDSDKVHVVYPGITMPTVNSKQLPEKIIQKYGITGEYILYVGTLQPRKNIERLIDAFKLIRKDLPKHKLVLVGKKGWLYESMFEKVQKENLADSVLFTGYVPEEELPAFYKGAVCFCLPSLYEGFGFPVLEAMREGVPVVASNVSSLPELVEDAGILVNPMDADDIARGIKKILVMNTSERRKLVEKGYQQTKKFTWEKAARQTIAVLEEVGNAH